MWLESVRKQNKMRSSTIQGRRKSYKRSIWKQQEYKKKTNCIPQIQTFKAPVPGDMDSQECSPQIQTFKAPVPGDMDSQECSPQIPKSKALVPGDIDSLDPPDPKVGGASPWGHG
ncbi:hypothetical protein EV702DRAFT_1045536 [Suillus placidus]|uniref:Uncharacterized protein n=1 Tax=Suillus placidus TaxID=48579 RepID=A0A9P6ZUR6_9AGAM|nr:hypothetical protein EV702DRAFT_1045536 [Suillus placidus]